MVRGRSRVICCSQAPPGACEMHTCLPAALVQIVLRCAWLYYCAMKRSSVKELLSPFLNINLC